MPKSNHIIQKQVLEVDMENPADSFRFRNDLATVFNEMILPQLTQLFDELGTPDKLYRLDQVSVDVGTIDKKNWEHELADKALAQIRQIIQLQDPLWQRREPVKKKEENNFASRKENEDTIQSFPEEKAGQENPDSTHHVAVNNKQKEKEDKRSEEYGETLFFYLSTGKLPWFAQNSVRLQDIFSVWFTADRFPLFNSFFAKADNIQRLRLVYLLNDAQLDNLISLFLSNENKSFLKEFVVFKNELLSRLHSAQQSTSLLNRLAYLPVFAWFSGIQNHDINAYYTSYILSYLKVHSPAAYKALTSIVTVESSSVIIQAIHTALTVPHLLSEIQIKEFQNKPTESSTSEEELFIENAGLVILHPFLPQLFEQLLLTKNNVFVSEDACVRAIMLTQYLVSGNVEIEDHQLMLNKIICGQDTFLPVLTSIELTNEEKQEADDLLQQVIALWKHNGVQVNGTVEGFRQSFLQRAAKLILKQNDAQLSVEQKPYDMLLSSLPWGMGIIKTPWMKGMLWVNWA